VPYRSSYGMAPLSGVDYGGGLSDVLRVPFADHMLIHAPSGLSPEAMAGVTDNVTTALTFVAEPLRQNPKAPILIVGGLGVALHTVQCAIGLGAEKVVYAGTDQSVHTIARRFGAEVVDVDIGPDTPPIGAFPLTIDASGTPDGLAFAIRCTAYEGLCQKTYGGFQDHSPVPLKEMYARNITLKLGRVHARAHMCETLELMEQGRLHPEHVITRRATFEDAVEAMLEPSIKLVVVRGEAT
jgi:threonine dehydrogenase-like Zn-dependent dehydrogenase